ALAWTVDCDVHGLGELGLLGHTDHRGLVDGRVRLCGDPVPRRARLAETLVVRADGLDGHAVAIGNGHEQAAGGGDVGAVMDPTQPLERREAPDLVLVTGHLEGVHVEGGELVALGGTHGDAVAVRHRCGCLRAGGGGVGHGGQPTDPSICSSIRRLSSRAYSMGSSLAIGSTNPRTIIAMASSSASPRLMR